MKRLILFLLPLVILGALLALFAANINRDPRHIAAVMIDKPAPQFSLPAVPGLLREGTQVPGFATEDFLGQVSLVNVFGSWCIPCRDEHPLLMALSRELDVPIFGINQKDSTENAIGFLQSYGNPYSAVGADRNGRVSIDWGIYGVPETFIVDANGIITFKFVGPLNKKAVAETLLPAIQAALEH